jgi:hypothetical protein
MYSLQNGIVSDVQYINVVWQKPIDLHDKL